MAESILSAAERAAHLTRQLIAYAGKGHFMKELVNVSDLVSQSMETRTASVPERVRIHVQLAPNLRRISTDPTQIEQILLNLVINAGEAIPPERDGSIAISTSGCEITREEAARLSVSWRITPGRYVVLRVEDDGSGMDERTMTRMFEPFFSTKFSGRGLGLAAIQGIVRSLNGIIEVRTAPHKGTTFQVRLPAAE
jgi:C4-dicarboxylate-specific signal transduction histidine kinase